MRFTSGIYLLALPLLFIRSARADLDLTPTESVQVLEEMHLKRILFHDGDKVIYYTPPRGWSCTGSHHSASLRIPDHIQATVTLTVSPRLRIPAFDGQAAAFFQQNPALLGLPKGAASIVINEVDLNPLMIDGHPTLDVQLTYSFFGQTCGRSILLINRNNTELSVVLDCLAPDYKMLHTAVRRSLYSFENL